MGNNNSMVSVMFEEIKSLLKSIEKKLDKKAVVKEIPPVSETITEPIPESKSEVIKPEQLIRVIAFHLQNAEQKIGKVSESVRESEKRVHTQMEELKRITISQKPDSNVRHHHMVDLKSSKVVVTIVSLSALLLASLFGNIRLLDVKSRMSDNDMKYRYIQSTNGINKEGLKKLKDVFHYQRDKKKIREIHDKVGAYERKVREAAEKIEEQTEK
ncbi:MAG: hypothetical protein JNK09_10880 [Prolixibacteraceae bacterium]|nr:hypothetical protein [Prolixibacteraceae bacterium]